jgi:hypothetical protein
MVNLVGTMLAMPNEAIEDIGRLAIYQQQTIATATRPLPEVSVSLVIPK